LSLAQKQTACAGTGDHWRHDGEILTCSATPEKPALGELREQEWELSLTLSLSAGKENLLSGWTATRHSNPSAK